MHTRVGKRASGGSRHHRACTVRVVGKKEGGEGCRHRPSAVGQTLTLTESPLARQSGPPQPNRSMAACSPQGEHATGEGDGDDEREKKGERGAGTDRWPSSSSPAHRRSAVTVGTLTLNRSGRRRRAAGEGGNDLGFPLTRAGRPFCSGDERGEPLDLHPTARS